MSRINRAHAFIQLQKLLLLSAIPLCLARRGMLSGSASDDMRLAVIGVAHDMP